MLTAAQVATMLGISRRVEGAENLRKGNRHDP